MQLNNLKTLKPQRKHLRNHSTSAEATLWIYLKNIQLEGRKFRRQHSIDFYILDFYCPSEKLNIELDGQEHFEGFGLVQDEKRDEFLKSLNIRILCFENKQIFENIDWVLNKIKAHFRT
ncbi:endonuclease domain-containing protein [Emticicia sp. SJ17W-69]|uniref:endonuclease domain-containing protein n=1 Tax=Emticicia sp. SJ17W-69 TaxID=3421657 RepID=UPI003EB9538C